MIFQFGEFRLDTNLMELRRSDAPVAIEPQVFDLLRLLIENRDRIVSRDEIVEKVWGGRIVSEATMSSRMNALRRAVGDDGKRQAFVRTVPRRGFRFVHVVETDDDNPTVGASAGDAAALGVKSSGAHPSRDAGEPLPLPDRPSIAVLPFENMSGDPEQEYFADGMAEDIITALSRCHWFFVIARNSSFTYKGKAIDVRRVGLELGVRYVLEGSVRRAGDRVRITAQLVEAATGNNLWAEKYDGALADVFDPQDRITEGVVGAVEPSVRQAEIERARRKKPESLDAYDLYLRALPHVWANTASESTKALVLLDEALKIDPSFVALHGLAALCHMLRSVHGNVDEAERAAALHHARAVLGQSVDDSNALSFAGIVHAILAHDFETALDNIDRAIALNPNSARAYANWGFTMMMTERDDAAAMTACQRAIRLSPFDPLNYGPETAISIIHYRRGDFAEALEAARRAIQISASFPGGLQMAAASYVHLDRLAEARETVRRLLEFHPRYRLDGVQKVGAAGSAIESVIAALREAGVPE